MNVFFKFIILILGIFLFSTVAVAQQNSNKQSIMFQVNQDSISFDNSTLESAIVVLVDATANEYAVRLKLKKEAAIKLKAITYRNIGKQSHLTLNGNLISSPTIQSEIGAEFVVTGLTREQAEKFVESIGK